MLTEVVFALVIHNVDIKHENILVSNINSDEPVVKLADLGASSCFPLGKTNSKQHR